MSRSLTTMNINHVLKLLGQNGLSGFKVETSSLHSALTKLGAFTPDISIIGQKKIIAELRRQNLIVTSHDSEIYYIQLSVKAIHRLQKISISDITIPIPNSWDQKWRMVLFDIPARHAKARYLLTSQLRRLGFAMLQSSCWVYPYPCLKEIEIITRDANIQPFVSIVEISNIDESTRKRLLRIFPDLY